MNTTGVTNTPLRSSCGEGSTSLAQPGAPGSSPSEPSASAGAELPEPDSAEASSTMPPELIALLDSPAAQPLVQELLVAIGTAFSQTASVRDPLPDTAPDSPEQGLAILAGIDHLRAILSHLDASWQVTTDQRMRAADAARDVRAADQGRAAAHEIALARRISPAS